MFPIQPIYITHFVKAATHCHYCFVATSRFLISCLFQSRIPKVGSSTATANVLWAIDLLYPFNFEFHTFLTLLLCSLITLSSGVHLCQLIHQLLDKCYSRLQLLPFLYVHAYGVARRLLFIFLAQSSGTHIWILQMTFQHLW